MYSQIIGIYERNGSTCVDLGGSSPEAHLARTREWPNPKPNPKPNPNPNPNPNTLTLILTLTLTLKTILARCASGLDPI